LYSGTLPILITLVIIKSLLAVGILFGVFMFLKSRRRRPPYDSHNYAHPINISALQKVATYEPERDAGTYYDPYGAGRSSEAPPR